MNRIWARSGGGWSWTPDAQYMTPRKVIHLLCDIVCKGGNLLLNIAPGPDGSWDAGAYEMLKGVGYWMQVNQEAIYNTHPIKPYKEEKVCFTQGDDGTVYMIYCADENEKVPPEKIWSSGFQPSDQTKISMLGTTQSLKWKKVGSGFIVDIPKISRKSPPCKYAWVLKLSD